MKYLNLTICLYFFSTICFAQGKELFQTISVPVDYADPDKGFTTIAYEFGAKFSETKPTVFIIADAQQFYVRKGAIASLQTSLLDSTFNVIGIIGRNNNSDLKKLCITANGNIDWTKAHTLFSWRQYVNDINEVRKRVVGESGHIYLYGQSGGGFLIHQFLSVYGQYVDKAFTGAAVNYFLDAKYGINHDRFWEQATEESPDFKSSFNKLISQNTINRDDLAMLFQRQHFFVTPDSLRMEREKLLNTLLSNDSTAIKEYKDKYQITAIQYFYSTDNGIPIRVRLFEFIFPLLSQFQIEKNQLQPDLENLYFSALPLIEAYESGTINPESMSFYTLHQLKTVVFILSGRYDHTADYRTQIALAENYPQHYLFIADDNHTFNKLKNNHMYQRLITAFFKSKNIIELDNLIKENYHKYRWIE